MKEKRKGKRRKGTRAREREGDEKRRQEIWESEKKEATKCDVKRRAQKDLASRDASSSRFFRSLIHVFAYLVIVWKSRNILTPGVIFGSNVVPFCNIHHFTTFQSTFYLVKYLRSSLNMAQTLRNLRFDKNDSWKTNRRDGRTRSLIEMRGGI